MVEGTEEELWIAGPGAPAVAEFCVAEFALAVGMSTAAGQCYLGDAVETRYRLPRLWGRVVAGQVPVWKARRIAQATLSLPPEGAAYVDVHLAPVAERCTFGRAGPGGGGGAGPVRPRRGRGPPRRGRRGPALRHRPAPRVGGGAGARPGHPGRRRRPGPGRRHR